MMTTSRMTRTVMGMTMATRTIGLTTMGPTATKMTTAETTKLYSKETRYVASATVLYSMIVSKSDGLDRS